MSSEASYKTRDPDIFTGGCFAKVTSKYAKVCMRLLSSVTADNCYTEGL